MAVGWEWAGRSTVGADEPQSQVFRVPRTHRVEQARQIRPRGGAAARAGGRGGTGWASLA